jgi:PTH1 family peptidyl-tRNA hydrolase
MGLFQKKPQVSSSAPLYTLGTKKNFLIIGLGNPGKQFTGTRHNIGFSVVDEFARANDFPDWTHKKDLKVELTSQNLADNRVILIKPQTYMNNSGGAAHAVQHFYHLYNQNTLAVYDELAIPIGQLRTRLGGSDAGHNGVKSLIQHLGEDFYRLRVGIGSEESQIADSADYVLGKFSKNEQSILESIIQEASSLITEFIFSNQFKPDTRTVN